MDAAPPDKPNPDVETVRTEVPLLFNIPIGMTSRYAHQMTVQGAENEVVLSFFEIIPPLLAGSAEEQTATLQKGVRAECVARITIAKARYPDFVKTMQDILNALQRDNKTSDTNEKASK